MADAESYVADYYFEISGVASDEWRVASFNGVEEVNKPFEFSLTLRGAELDVASMLDQSATLTIHAPGGSGLNKRRLFGIVAGAAMIGKEREDFLYEIELVPRLWRLGLSRDHRIFQDLTYTEVIKAVLEDNGLVAGDDFDLDTAESDAHKKRAYVCQWDETDLDFVHRLCEQEGLCYCFEMTEDREKLKFKDDITEIGEITAFGGPSEITYRDASAMVSSIAQTIHELRNVQNVTMAKVSLRDYNYKMPDKVEGSHQGSGPDTYEDYTYPGRFFVAGQGDVFAKIKLQQYEIRRKLVVGKTDCRYLAAGFSFTVANHFLDALNAKYLILRVRHRGADASSSGGAAGTFETEFTAIPADVPFKPEQHTRKPRVWGPITAKVTGPAGEKLHMDEFGRAKVKFFFDRSDTRDDQTSAWLRVSHPYAGKDHGIQFHPCVGDEVIVSFSNGDPDLPLITGRLYNADDMPPLKNENRIQNVIYTPYQHKMMFDDKGAFINLNTGGNETLHMGDGSKDFGNQIKLSTADGHMMHLRETGDAGIEIKTKESNYVIFNDTGRYISINTTDGHQLRLTDDKQEVHIQTTGGHQFCLDDAEQACWLMTTGQHRFGLSDAKNFIAAQTAGEHSLKLDDDNQQCELMTTAKHAIILNDQSNFITIQSGDGNHIIKIDQAASKISVESKTGSIDLLAPLGDINIKGKAITIEATTDLKLKGMNVSSTADIAHGTKGNMVTSEASAVNTIKGAMVHLNP